MSGNLPFCRLTGEALRSSGKRYFSFCRRTLETVLCGLDGGSGNYCWAKSTYLLSTPNMAVGEVSMSHFDENN